MNSTNRLMGDATNQGVPALAQVPGLQLVAGYVTGRAMTGIMWLPSDWAQFPGITHVYIDQGSDGSPVPAATVRDVEPGAWLPQNAVNRLAWNTPRPTIYCDQFDLSRAGGVLWCGWQGDLWLAIPGWQPGDPLPATPGCTVVAVQNDFSHPAYDLSIVLDPAWPAIGGKLLMEIVEVDRTTVPAGVNWPGDWLLKGDGTISHIQTVAQFTAYVNAGLVVKTISYTDWQALAGVQ